MSSLTDTVRIVHDQKEGSASEDPARYFEIEWQLTLELTKHTTKLQANLMIKNVKFGEEATQEVKQDLMTAWLGFNKSAYDIELDIDALF